MDKDEIKRQVSMEQLLARYGRTVVAGKKMQCLCPENHNNYDADPSMDLYGNRVFCRTRECFGDKGADIFGVVGLMEGLPKFVDQLNWLVREFNLSNGPSPHHNRSILRAYKWTDSQGRTAYHLRTDDLHHKFTWNQQADESGDQQLKPCTPDLYQREQVIVAHSVIVCAGERDCDTANRWLKESGQHPEIVTTCNHTGEFTVMAESFILLHGKRAVYAIGDNDPTGESYRQKVCGFLQSKVGNLFAVHVPAAFNDITEWAESGVTAQDFIELLTTAESVPAGDKGETQEEEAQPDSIEKELQTLAMLSELAYFRVRKDASKRLEIKLGTLDSLVKTKRREVGQGKQPQGREVTFDEILPAEAQVEGGELLANIIAFLNQFLMLPVGAPLAISLWVLRAYAHDAFGVNPRLTFLSPEKRCGKTTALDAIGAIVPKPLLSSNASPSSIFRVIEKAAPTLVLDEMDSFQECHEELRGILNSGHTRTAAHVIRTVGDDHEPRKFSTWCPMILAAIGSLPDTLEDRSIIIRMDRKKKADKVDRLTHKAKSSTGFKEQVDTLKRQCTRWASDNLATLAEADPATIEALSDRANDNWASLLAIARACGDEWPKKAQTAALQLSGKETITNTIGEQLLSDIKAIFNDKKSEQIASQDLCDALISDKEKPWATWGKGFPITMVKIAKLLKNYGITSQTIREGMVTFKGYYKANFEDGWERYLSSSLENQSSKSNKGTTILNKEEAPDFQKVTDPPCYSSKNTTSVNPGQDCDTVTLQDTESHEEEENADEVKVLFSGEEEEFDVDV